MPKCPQCENGKMTITMSTFGSKEPPTKTEIKCVHCHGTGQLSQKDVDHIEWEKKQWCKCGNPSGQVKSWRDGENPICHKHCWTCRDCGKLVQVG